MKGRTVSTAPDDRRGAIAQAFHNIRYGHGIKAAELFADLDALLRTPAREHAVGTIHA